jgi:hypothetical protein
MTPGIFPSPSNRKINSEEEMMEEGQKERH